jgi:hypothetical protein
MDEDIAEIGFLAFCTAFFIAGLIWQGLWSAMFAATCSGDPFLAGMAIMGFIITTIGAFVLLYCLLIALVYGFLFALIFGIPAYLIYDYLGPEKSIILAVVIGILILLYLIETNTVRVEHHTITLAVHRKYVIKR